MINSKFTQDILIIGFGAQAKAWALNLTDSGRKVSIGLRSGSTSSKLVKNMGFEVIELNSPEISDFMFIINLTSDDQHKQVLQDLSPLLVSEQVIIYAHGFSVTYQNLKELYPTQNHILLAPKAIASEVRFNYQCQSPLTGVLSTEFLNDKHLEEPVLQLAKDLGINVGPIRASFADETKADLFSEQSLLCSLIPYGAMHSFEKLISKGISHDLAYIECWHEVKLIADAMLKFGPKDFFELISPNALAGGELGRERIFNSNLLKILDDIYEDIESGNFFQTTQVTDFQMVSAFFV